MSTRANIIVTDLNGKSVQYYHHHDGYPTYMGKMLETFATAATFMPGSEDEAFKKLLDMEKSFELEENAIHSDIEYCWYVQFKHDEIIVSYTKVEHGEEVEDLLQCVEGFTIYA